MRALQYIKPVAVACGIAALVVVCLFSKQNHAANNARYSTEPYLGEIMIVPYNFEPRGWADCNGQLLSISQNSALFSLLGTTYGGDGRTTFGLPDLRGRCPVHVGEGPVGTVKLGQRGGGTKVAKDETSAARTQPYAGTRFVIATQGVFPSRN